MKTYLAIVGNKQSILVACDIIEAMRLAYMEVHRSVPLLYAYGGLGASEALTGLAKRRQRQPETRQHARTHAYRCTA